MPFLNHLTVEAAQAWQDCPEGESRHQRNVRVLGTCPACGSDD